MESPVKKTFNNNFTFNFQKAPLPEKNLNFGFKNIEIMDSVANLSQKNTCPFWNPNFNQNYQSLRFRKSLINQGKEKPVSKNWYYKMKIYSYNMKLSRSFF